MTQVQIITAPCADQSKELDFGLISLTEAIARVAPDTLGGGFLGGQFGYGANYENSVFTMRTFYWGDCDCGFEERSETWHAANPHSSDCFRTVLHARFSAYDKESGYDDLQHEREADDCVETTREETDFGTVVFSRPTTKGDELHERWRDAYDARKKARERLTSELYGERGLKASPYQWLCTCGVDERAEAYFTKEGHYATCALELPNFLHKATGFEVRWYKWIGRDMEFKGEADINAMFEECVASVTKR